MKKVICFAIAALLLFSSAGATNLENVYRSKHFTIYPIAGYAKGEVNDVVTYTNDKNIIIVQEVEFDLNFKSVIAFYDLLFARFLASFTDDVESVEFLEPIDFFTYTVKIASVPEKGSTRYVAMVPAEGGMLILVFQSISTLRPAKDFELFLYGVTPKEE